MLIRDLPIHGLAHITGGGISENVVRILPRSCKVLIRKGSWSIPPVFKFLQDAGNVTDSEMLRTFNNGIGMIAVVPEQSAQDVLERLNGAEVQAFLMGEVVERKDSEERIAWI
jgi:phosphoribosylformylglycinamidine cyclo-ligase